MVSAFSLCLFTYYVFNSRNELVLEKPLIIVNGIIAPSLSKINGHMKYINEKNCMNCHISAASFDEIKETAAPLIPHMYREKCNSCHFIKE